MAILRCLMMGGIVLVLGACSPSLAERQNDPETLSRGELEPLSLDPLKMATQWEFELGHDLYSGLFAFDARAEVVPDLVKSWSVSDDGLTWRFELEESFWSDGTPVTADDYVYAFHRAFRDTGSSALSPVFPSLMNVGEVASGILEPEALGVEAESPSVLILRLSEPTPFVPSILAQPAFFPIPRHVVEQYGDGWLRSGIHQSSGAYRLVEWRHGDRIVLEKNPGYVHSQDVCMAHLIYRFTPEGQNPSHLALSGEVDLITHLPHVALEPLLERHPNTVRQSPSFNMLYVVLNTRMAPFDNRTVRQALSMALDRDAFMDVGGEAGDQPAYSLVPRDLENYDPPQLPAWTGQSLSYRRAQARELLEAAGYGRDNPLRFTFARPEANSELDDETDLLKQWQAIAPWIEVEDIRLPLTVFYEEIFQGRYHAQTIDWGAGGADPGNYLYMLYHADGEPDLSGWNNLEFQALADRAIQTQSVEQYMDLAAQSEAVVLREVPVIPVLRISNASFVRPEITGWVDNTFNFHPSRYLCVGERP